MLLIVIRLLYLFVCAGAIASYVGHDPLLPLPIVGSNPFLVFVALLLFTQLVTIVDMLIKRKEIEVVTAVYFGLLIGSLLSYLLNLALKPIVHPNVEPATQLVTFLALPYMCISLLLQTKDKFRFVIPYIEFDREIRGGKPYVIDTSTLIDGRIAEVINTKVIDSQMIVPSFVLKELQDIADSSDKLRRNRGRRGLDVLQRLRNCDFLDVKLYESSDPEEAKDATVDQKLVLLAKKLGGRVITSDFNLNKVASVQGVEVINLNDLANSLRPPYLPGERLTIKLVKPGEGNAQAVGYLDDGTMVVCEEGSHMIGRDTDIIVKSVLQSSAGRMIFGRLPGANER